MRVIVLALFFPFTSWGKNFMPSSFSANFEESFISVVTGKEKKGQGKIDYRYPGHIRFEKMTPDPSLFMSNREKSWYYVPPFLAGKEGQVTIQDAGQLPLTKLLDSIKNGIEGSKLFTHKYEGRDLILAFPKAAQKDFSLKEAILHSSLSEAKKVKSLAEFQKLTLIYVDGRKVHLSFSKLQENAAFPPDYFVFKVPANTKVIEN